MKMAGIIAQQNFGAVLTSKEDVRIERRPMPSPAADEVLVQVEAVGICSSDAYYYRHGSRGRHVVEYPFVLGHEAAGTVVETGRRVTNLRVGNRVAIEPGAPCGRCDQCRRGYHNLCHRAEFKGTPPKDGALQRYVAVRSDFAFRLPANLSTELGALVEPLSVAISACRKAGVSAGSRVVITGLGPVGLLACQVAQVFGATVVAGTDLDEAKVVMAEAFGVRRLPAGEDGAERSFDVHLECSGSPSAALAGITLLAPLGISVLVGTGASDDLHLPISDIQERELRITGVFRYRNCFPLAIDLLARDLVRAEELITGRFTLSDSPTALRTSGQRGTIKNVVHPNR